jgi:hypothetical protein
LEKIGIQRNSNFSFLKFSRIREPKVRRHPWEPEGYSLEGGKISSLHPRATVLNATTLKLGEALRGQSFPKCKAGNVF